MRLSLCLALAHAYRGSRQALAWISSMSRPHLAHVSPSHVVLPFALALSHQHLPCGPIAQVHSFKSMALYIGAHRVVRCAQELQNAAIAGKLTNALLALESLERSFLELETWVHKTFVRMCPELSMPMKQQSAGGASMQQVAGSQSRRASDQRRSHARIAARGLPPKQP